MTHARYFKDEEFGRCAPPCSIDDMEQSFMDVLDELRERAGIPLVLNSAYRSRDYELTKGRSGNSSHTHGLAVDIRCATSQNRMKIIRAALEMGVARIGVAGTYVHVDIGDRVGLPVDVIWTY